MSEKVQKKGLLPLEKSAIKDDSDLEAGTLHCLAGDSALSASGTSPEVSPETITLVRIKLLEEDPTCQGIKCQGQPARMLRLLEGVSDF